MKTTIAAATGLVAVLATPVLGAAQHLRILSFTGRTMYCTEHQEGRNYGSQNT
jgi:hypothetical protein